MGEPAIAQPEELSIWESVENCAVCGSSDSKVKYEGTTDSDTEKLLSSYSASGNFISKETLVTCSDCQFVYTNPRVRGDLILKGYEDAEDPTYVSQADGRIKSFERCLKAVEKYCPVGRVLDVGAAAGFFLKVARDKGWMTYGIEPSRYLSDYGNRNYNVNIFNGTIEAAPKWDPMDMVCLWDVLEHTLDPNDVLQRCNRYLKKDGIIVINYPNIGNWMAKLAGKNYWFIISVHLYYFVPSTIKKMLENNGFEVLEDGPHFQWLQFGYLCYRLEAYMPKIGKLMGKVAKMLGMSNMLIPYYAAQTRVVARKVSDK